MITFTFSGFLLSELIDSMTLFIKTKSILLFNIIHKLNLGKKKI